MNNFWTGSRWFYRQCLTTFCYFLQPESRKWLFGKLHLCPSIKHRPNPIEQVFCTRCMLCLSPSWRFQLSALPRQTGQRAQNTYSITFIVCSFKHAPFASAQMRRCVQKTFF